MSEEDQRNAGDKKKKIVGTCELRNEVRHLKNTADRQLNQLRDQAKVIDDFW